MADGFFYWIGVSMVSCAALIVTLVVLAWLYSRLIHNRFGTIFFSKGQCRLSLATWHPSALVGTEDSQWGADDHVISERPFYLSYRIGKRRLFLMAGLLGDRRYDILKGVHP